MPVKSHLQSCYILTFIDNFSGYALIAFICAKNAVLQHFHNMVSWAETFTGHSLTFVYSDQGGEFLGQDLQLFFSSRGITQQTSVPHIPQQNGCAERFNHTLLEKAEAMQQHVCLPKSFWLLRFYFSSVILCLFPLILLVVIREDFIPPTLVTFSLSVWLPFSSYVYNLLSLLSSSDLSLFHWFSHIGQQPPFFLQWSILPVSTIFFHVLFLAFLVNLLLVCVCSLSDCALCAF